MPEVVSGQARANQETVEQNIMPPKVPSLVTRVAHLVGAIIQCPKCGRAAVYGEKEISLYGMTCNKCLQPFSIAISERLVNFCKPCQQKVRKLPDRHRHPLARENPVQAVELDRLPVLPVRRRTRGGVLRAKDYSSLFEAIGKGRQQ